MGIVVIDRAGRVLGLERSDVPGGWQVPQGGLGAEEEPIDAAKRELQEETGIAWGEVELLDEYPDWLVYELPVSHRNQKTGRGQVHRWFLMRFVGDDDNIDLNAGSGGGEFIRWCWLPIDELVASTWDIRRPIYKTFASHWSTYLT